VLTKSSAAGLKRIAYPDAVITPRFGGRPLPEAIVRNTQTLFVFYMMVFVTATVGLALVDAASGSAVDLVTATSAVASALGNIGPGLAGVGPGESYQAIAAGGKWLLAFVMIVGRLEIFPMLLLFTRYLWRR
jgi:trk system potassium uptake protein TrkH